MGKRSPDFEKKPRANSYKHGHRYANSGGPTLEYNSWASIKQRTSLASSKLYKYYGGRGIDMDPRWIEFNAFYEDVGPSPGPSYTIDRMDNEGGYWKDNVRWATKKEQSSNKRNTILVGWLGEKTCLKAVCEKLGWKYKTTHRWVKEGKTFYQMSERAKELWEKDQTT